jgi:hypothetical protein
MPNPSHTPPPHFVSFLVFTKTIVYIAMRCIMNAKKILVNAFQSENASPGFRQHAVAIRNTTLPRKLRYRIRKDKTQIVPCMPLYRNTMYYEHKGFFCQYPLDIAVGFSILHSRSGIELSSCKSDWITRCSSFHCWLSPTHTSEHQAAVFSSQAKTILQTHIHLGRTSYVGDIIQVTVRVRGLIIYGWVDNPFVHD